jgi:hypothetical protein
MYNMEITIGKYKFNLEIILLIIVVIWFLIVISVVASSDVKVNDIKEGFEKIVKEGFSNVNVGGGSFGPEFSESKSPGYILPPETWSMPTLEYSKGTTPSIGAEAILDRPAQPIPLPEGQLDFLATTPFRTDCCPSAFSTSTGCACLTMDQYKYLHERGGNNVPFSQY